MTGVPAVRVLVVDDHRDTAASLAGLLVLAGFHARYYLDGPAALAAAPAFAPDVCVLDLRMPGMDGFALAAELRTTLGDGVALIALTGDRGDDLDSRLVAAGFRDRFAKPADPVALLRAIAAAAGPGCRRTTTPPER
jgi:CheY-like chemotaxis protein